jgi:hypothetical protein
VNFDRFQTFIDYKNIRYTCVVNSMPGKELVEPGIPGLWQVLLNNYFYSHFQFNGRYIEAIDKKEPNELNELIIEFIIICYQ